MRFQQLSFVLAPLRICDKDFFGIFGKGLLAGLYRRGTVPSRDCTVAGLYRRGTVPSRRGTVPSRDCTVAGLYGTHVPSQQILVDLRSTVDS